MELEEIRKKYQCDEGRTFAQWKEWVRKNKPSQAQAHIVKAVAPNGSKYERVIGGYTDAQNTAFDLVSHGYKDVKLYHSVNAGPLKLLRNFSVPLHGAKFKDSANAVDSIREKYAKDASLSQKKDQPVKVTNISIKPSPVGGFEGNVYYSKNGETDLYSPWHIMANGKWGFPFGRTSTRLTPSDKKLIEQKIKKLVAPKGVKVKDSVDFQQDKLLITSNGFANGSGTLKKDTRKGLKPFEVAFIVKGKDGKPFRTVRSKMAASLEEAKRWANQESRKYNGVTKVEVKEFKDSVDSVDFIRQKYAKDAAFGVKVKGNEKGSERLTMEKVFKELNPAPAWKKVKKGNTIVIRTNINGKDQDVVTIKYFNPNVVAMTPKGGAANMVALKDVTVMCSKLGVEGRRSYNDSADCVERIRAKYSVDAASQELKVNSVYFKKDSEGNVRGDVEFERNGKYATATFGVYASGNWDVKPWMNNSALNKATPAEKATLVKAIKAKIGSLGTKLKSF